MKTMTKIALLSATLTVALAACVQSRDPRNGVFNENVYLRKDFLIRSGTDANSTDPGWFLKATVINNSSPNPLGDLNFGTGIHSQGQLVRFRVMQDHLDMLDLREVDETPSTGRVPEVVNSWAATNVDLKYRINLDGEATNFYEENQELGWEQRQWLKLNLAKNDLSDVAAMGLGMPDLFNHCTDVGESSTTLVPESVVIDDTHGYLQWTVQITVPIRTDLQECIDSYGPMLQPTIGLNRPNVTFELMYSLVRATPTPTYVPLKLAEKDPILHKYGPILFVSEQRDPNTGLLAANQYVMRFDPTKPIVWYFDKGFPEKYKAIFLGPGGVKEQTNKLFADANVATRLDFKDYDKDMPADMPDDLKARGREFGDVRYNFLRWVADQEMQGYWAAVTQFTTDPRTGESTTSDVVFNDYAVKDHIIQRIDAFLQYMGASLDTNADGEWMDGPANCKDGDTMPILPASRDTWAGKSTLFQKMQLYLNHDPSQYGNQAPTDFVRTENLNDPDFQSAYYKYLPYQIFADPDANPFVTREGGAGVYGADQMWNMRIQEAQFHKLTSDIDHGLSPYNASGPGGIQAASQFLNQLKAFTENHHKLEYAKQITHPFQKFDSADAFSLEAIISKDARHCINGHWETKAEWQQNLIDTYWSQVAWHEFGHTLGLEHNFMGSVDRPNFPHYTDGAGRDHYSMYSSSVMEYNALPDDVFWHAGWAPYDQGAITWMYANTAPDTSLMTPATSLSGQIDATHPWKDVNGFDSVSMTEKNFLRCSEQHMMYTPMCRQGDMGTTPSEIIANQLESYEWNYFWRNFRLYRKFWDNTYYANGPAGLTVDMRRFISMWVFDWSSGELQDSLRRIGIQNPDPNGSDAEYFSQLADKFNAEMSQANQLVAAFHKAVIQQGSGERPFATVYDKYFGDETQQGIILDKLFAMQGWTGMWPTDNYDQNQAGFWLASYSGIGDSSYNAVAEDVVDSMIGGQYDVYPYFRPLAVVQFAQDTHDPSFSGRLDVRDWVGGQPFQRLDDFLTYFRNIAVNNSYTADGCDMGISACKYDPREHSDSHNEFIAPDKRVWAWSYIPDRNQYVAVLKDRNTASYIVVRSYNDDVVNLLDDGAFPGSAYGLELPMKYMMDAFSTYR
jgi:hypothetical protein